MSSRFDQEQVVSFQMSLPSGILCSKKWKFARDLVCQRFGGQIMSEAGVRGIDLFKIAGESISGWIPSWKTGEARPTRQPFCSQMEERLLLYLEYHPQVAWYGRGDISATFASTYKIATPLPTPYTISYLFEDKAHPYLPDVTGQLLDGSLLIAEAGLEEDKRQERNRAKAEAARKVAQQQGGVYWIGTEATLSRTRHANLVFLHARRQGVPAWSQLEEAGPRDLALGRSGLRAGTGRAFGRTMAAGGKGSRHLEKVC